PVSAAAAATAAPQAWAESPVGHHGAAPAYQPEASYPPQQAYQPEPAPFQQAAYQPPAGKRSGGGYCRAAGVGRITGGPSRRCASLSAG
ncbi:hypothetical protein CQA48_30110, partial [Klebsiella pneumoniae]